MTHGVYFALLSMSFAGVNDVVFKKYSAKERSRGMYVLGIGMTWAVLQVVFMHAEHVAFTVDNTSIIYGLIAGALLTASNIFLIESLTHIDVSLGSTVYRLNTIGVVLLSFFILREFIGALKLCGIVLGVCSVLLMYGGDKTRNPLGKTATFFWLVVVASLCRALYGIVSKAGLSAHAEPQPMLLLVACCWIIGGAFYAAVIEKRFVITRKKIVYSLLSGSMVFCIVNFLMLGLADEQASVVIPIANMSFVVALFISSVLKLEKLNGRKFMAACCAMVSIFLLANV